MGKDIPLILSKSFKKKDLKSFWTLRRLSLTESSIWMNVTRTLFPFLSTKCLGMPFLFFSPSPFSFLSLFYSFSLFYSCFISPFKQSFHFITLFHSEYFVTTHPLHFLISSTPHSYPSGVGALLVRTNTLRLLTKPYFGGGTYSLLLKGSCILRDGEEAFEDGTQNFHSFIQVEKGFDLLERLKMKDIEKYYLFIHIYCSI